MRCSWIRAWFGLLLAIAAFTPSVRASHATFAFEVDRLELDGNQFGPHDGVADVIDEFDDGDLSQPLGFIGFLGTRIESGGVLSLESPGDHVPSPFGVTVDMSLVIALPSGNNSIAVGAGDATVTSYWIPTIPGPGGFYHFTLVASGTFGSVDERHVAVGVAHRSGNLQIEQYEADFEILSGVFTYTNTVVDSQPFDAGDVTGMIGLRFVYDDATKLLTGSFSLDGGSTWLMPFPARSVNGVLNNVALTLNAGRALEGSGTTTTTVTSTTSSTTTTITSACPVTDCRRTTRALNSRLTIKDKPTDKGDAFAWKLRRGEDTTSADFGDPSASTDYSLCVSDGTGGLVMQATIPAGGQCRDKPCWKATGSGGWKYSDPLKTQAGIRKIVLKPGDTGSSQVLVKGRGESLDLPTLPIESFPLTVRLEAANGECWANVFEQNGVGTNLPAQLKASGD